MSKSGLYFCCRDHKDKSQKIGGIKEIIPEHYGTSLAIKLPGIYPQRLEHRKIAFNTQQHKCNKCGYDTYPQVLEVHHIDGNASNNDPHNLEILCPTHHNEIHFITKTGPWARRPKT
jgi:5-methylcytosine-specific restriction endonuclease McrA